MDLVKENFKVFTELEGTTTKGRDRPGPMVNINREDLSAMHCKTLEDIRSDANLVNTKEKLQFLNNVHENNSLKMVQKNNRGNVNI